MTNIVLAAIGGFIVGALLAPWVWHKIQIYRGPNILERLDQWNNLTDEQKFFHQPLPPDNINPNKSRVSQYLIRLPWRDIWILAHQHPNETYAAMKMDGWLELNDGL